MIWGGYLAFARAGIVAGLDALDVAFFRFATAGLCLAPWFIIAQRKPATHIAWTKILVATLLIGPAFVLLGVGGFSYAPLAHGALVQSAVLMLGTIVLATWLAHASITLVQTIAASMLLLGLTIAIAPSFSVPAQGVLIGDAMFASSALMWALFAALQRRWRLSPLDITASISVISALIVVPIYLLQRGSVTLQTMAVETLIANLVVHGLLVGIAAIVAFTEAVDRLGAPRAAMFPAIVPAVALIVGIPLTGEVPSAMQWVGLAVVTGGLMLGTGAFQILSVILPGGHRP